ncbi:MAG: hypothetical protein EOO04_27505, partial [Chitinophagaceae bacterium]
MMTKSVFAFAALCLTLASCSSDSEDLMTTPTPNNCDTTTVTYSANITPLITKYGCLSCHSGTAPVGGFVLTSYNAVKAKVTDGRLFGAITHANGFSPMPQGGAVSI